jgi:hypothetical protein
VKDSPHDPLAWVRKRGGQVVPFEADKISRALFAAGEALGRPDAFLARELTDGVVHFLAEECEGGQPTTGQVADLVVKVVRELGQPALAEAFAAHAQRRSRAGRPASRPQVVLKLDPDLPLESFVPACWQAYTLQAVFARDLTAAHEAGLLVLGELQHPGQLAACVLSPPPQPGTSFTSVVESTARFVGRLLALDSPEYLLAVSPGLTPAAFAAQLERGLEGTGLRAVVNLNCATPPSWAGAPAAGPLFAEQSSPPSCEHLARIADELVEPLLALPGVRIDWHLGERDLAADGPPRKRLLRLVSRAMQGDSIGFVFDRPRRPLALAEGMDRQHPAVLLSVGLDLPRLAEQPGIDGDAQLYLHKLGSLTRLALSAGVQKRAYLRRRERSHPPQGEQPSITSGFLLDRARLLAVPLELDGLVYSFLNKGLAAGGASLDLGRQVVERLCDVLRQGGRTSHLDGCVDGPWDFRLEGDAVAKVAGLTPWDPTAAWKSVLRAGGVLHGVADHGTGALVLPSEPKPSAEEVAGWLKTAWQQTEVVRVRLVPTLPS